MSKLAKLLTILLALMIIFSCQKDEVTSLQSVESLAEPAKASVETADITPVEAPAITQGMITYLSGEVDVLFDGEWYPVEIGDMLEEGTSLKTGAAAYCEVQFGNIGLIRVQENTQVAMKDLQLIPDKSKVDVGVTVGTVLAKVKKLGEDELFNVRTQTAVCGVRGTEFSVSTDESKVLNVAVKEGAVTVVPVKSKVQDLKEKIGKDNEELVNIVKELEESVTLVEANQEVRVDEETLEEAAEVMSVVEEALEEVLAESESDVVEDEGGTPAEDVTLPVRVVDSAKLQNIRDSLRDVQAQVKEKVAPVAEVSEIHRDNFLRMEKMVMLDIAVQSDPTEAAATTESEEEPADETEEETPPPPRLHKISLKIEPSEAEISLDGDMVGKGVFSGIYVEGKELTFTVHSNGYASHILNVMVSDETAKVYKIGLVKLEQPPKEVKTEEPPEQEPEKEEATEGPVEVEEDEAVVEDEPEEAVTYSVLIQVEPSDAEILIDGDVQAAGSFRREYESGTELLVTLQRQGFESQEVKLAVGSENIRKTVSLREKTIQFVSPVTEGNIRGRILHAGDRLLVADKNGVVAATDLEGNTLWRVETNNRPNENSYPVVTGNLVYFSGSKELVMIDLADGSVLQKTPLQSDESHLFGRRVVVSPSGVLFPGNNTIKVFDAPSGDMVEEIPLPQASRMTPAVWNNNIIIADEQGTLLFITTDGAYGVEDQLPTGVVQPIALAPVVRGNRAVFSGRKGDVVCVALDSKQVLWKTTLPEGRSVFTDAVITDKAVYVFAEGVIHPLSAATGELLFDPIHDAAAAPAYSAGTIVYGSGRDMVLLDGATGKELKRIGTPAVISGTPAVYGKKIALGTEGGHIVIIHND